MGPFLDVSESLTGRTWIGPDIETARAAEALMQDTGLPLPLCAVLARRGVAAQEVDSFLAPTLRDTLPDPHRLADMERAAARLIRALETREKIAIFADYDVDGGASAALLLDWLRQMGHDASLYIPDRITEGYGPNVPAMEKLADSHSLIVCVDCGTLSHDPIAAAAAKGAETLVFDHHLGGETLPPAVAVVNPNRQDESGDLGYFCAAGVVFLALVEAGRQMRAAGRKGPDLMAMLDLVALATVADVAPLIEANRALVVQGLKVMARRERPGLAALADVARMAEAPRPYHLGFLLGPRINAGGRIGKADLGARLLACRDPAEAAAMAARLDQLNEERREIESGVQAAALADAEPRGLDAPLVWAAGDGWHPGVVGIVAARIKEATHRPAVVIGFDGDEGKGSGRSVSGIDLGASIQRLAAEGLIERGGGHRMAAGLSLSRAQLVPAMDRLTELLARQGSGEGGAPRLHLDGVLMPEAATLDLIDRIEAAGPFGAGAPGPRFAFPGMAITYARRVGEKHLKISFASGPGGTRLDAIAFSAFDTPLGPALEGHAGARFHLAGRLETNTWQGRTSPQLRLEDAAPAG